MKTRAVLDATYVMFIRRYLQWFNILCLTRGQDHRIDFWNRLALIASEERGLRLNFCRKPTASTWGCLSSQFRSFHAFSTILEATRVRSASQSYTRLNFGFLNIFNTRLNNVLNYEFQIRLWLKITLDSACWCMHCHINNPPDHWLHNHLHV